MKKISQIEQALKENFDWEDFDGTKLDGREWNIECESMISKFVGELNKSKVSGAAYNQALESLKELFTNAIDDNKK